MKIVRNNFKRTTLEEFADQHELVMEISERDTVAYPSLPRYFACFQHCELKCDGMLIGAYGNGDTPEEAMKDYAKRISGKALAFFDPDQGRHDLQVPVFARPTEEA